MIDWLRLQFGSLGLAIITALLVAVLGLFLRDWSTRIGRRRRWARARIAESAAPRILTQSGYEVIGAQVPGEYTLAVDGRAESVSLRADFIVARHGRKYVAEVKSGRSAPLLSTAATRRQLLEYLIAFPVDGVLLVNAETKHICEVNFPMHRAAPATVTGTLGMSIAALVLLAVVVFYFVQR